MITARDLTKVFGNITALAGVSFVIEPGEFVFLTGPSGSGKTTLFRLILRDYQPTSGTLTVNGEDLRKLSSNKVPLYRRTIGPVFQDFKLMPDRNIWENVALPLLVRGVNQIDISAAVKVALEMVGLASRIDAFPAQLSGGEIQRIAIARAVVGKPKLILADEPTGNLDPKTAADTVKLLREIHSELKTTILMATHNVSIVNHAAQRVITLENGKLVKDSAKGKYDE